jgi:DNA replication protein DnaC
MPWSAWHDHIGDPAIADAILDRRVNGSAKIDLKGKSMRKSKAHSLYPCSFSLA